MEEKKTAKEIRAYFKDKKIINPMHFWRMVGFMDGRGIDKPEMLISSDGKKPLDYKDFVNWFNS